MSEQAPSRLGHNHATTLGLALKGLSVIATVGAGAALGRVMLTQRWTDVASLIGLGAAALLLLLTPRAGLLAWILLAPYAPHIYLSLELGSGIPNLDLGRLATLLLLFVLVSAALLRRPGDPRWSPMRDRQSSMEVQPIQARRLTVAPARLGSVEALMAAFVVGMSLSVLTAGAGIVAGVQNIFDFIAMPCLVYYFARTWLRTPGDLRVLVGMIAVAGVLMAFITVREQLTGQALFSPVFYSLDYEEDIRKVMSLFGHPATISAALAISVPILVYGLRQAPSAHARLLLSVALVAVLAGVFFAYMRAGWLGAFLGLALTLALNRELRRALLPLLPLVLVAGVAVALLAVQPEAVADRLSSEAPITYRVTAWQIAWTIFRASPVFGIGWRQFGHVAVEQFNWNPHPTVGDLPSPHNTYLDAVTTGGLLALLPYLAIFAAVLVTGYRYYRRNVGREAVAALWATTLSYMAIIGSFDAFNAQYANMLYFLIAGALIGRLEDETERRKAESRWEM